MVAIIDSVGRYSEMVVRSGLTVNKQKNHYLIVKKHVVLLP